LLQEALSCEQHLVAPARCDQIDGSLKAEPGLIRVQPDSHALGFIDLV
jgi:hypothetical protein